MILECCYSIRGESDCKDHAQQVPDAHGEKLPKGREHDTQHNCIKQHIRNAVKLGTKLACDVEPSCDEAVQHIGKTRYEVQNIERPGQWLCEEPSSRADDTQRRYEVWNMSDECHRICILSQITE